MNLSIRMLSFAIAVWTLLITPAYAQEPTAIEDDMAAVEHLLSQKHAELSKMEIAIERAERGDDGEKYNKLNEQRLSIREEMVDLEARLGDLRNDRIRQELKRARQPLSTQVFMLKNLDGWEFIDTIKNVYRVGSVSYVQRTNSVVVREQAETLAQVAELLEQLEQQAATKPGDEQEVRVFQLKHHHANYIADILETFFEHRAKFRGDSGSFKLMVQAAPLEMEKIERLLAKLSTDEPESAGEIPQTLSVNIDLIQATTGSRERGDLPDNLREVGEALLAQGVGNPRMYGHLMVRAAEGEAFHSNGMVRSVGTDRPTYVKIKGRAYLEADEQAKLELRANIETPIAQSRGPEKASAVLSYEDFGIETNSIQPLGNYMVVGAIPTRLEDADTVLIVIRVTTE